MSAARKTRTCDFCDADIEHLRAGARFCDASCRTRALKARKRARGLDPYKPWPTLDWTKSPADPERNVPSALSERNRPQRRARNGRHDGYDNRSRPSLTPEQVRQILAAVDDPEIRRRFMDASPEAVRRRREEREACR